MAVAYAIVGWLVIEIASVAGPALRLPEWSTSLVFFLILLGMPLAIIFAWAFELTPEGLKREKNVDRHQSITSTTGRKLDNVIIGLLILAVGYFAFDKFVLDPDRDAIEIEAALQKAQVAPSDNWEMAKSIAVLPFVNMSDDPNNEYFSDGLSEELLNLLAKIPDLRVVARTSSFSFKEQPDVTVSEIAELLNVAHILEGSVRKSGNQIRITAQLIDANNGFNIWSATYDRELENIFETQDEIAAAVTESLKVSLLGDTPKSRETDTAAYQLFLEGQFLAHQGTNESLRQSISLLEQAVEIAPDYAPAWAALAGSYWWLSAYGGMPIDEGFDFADAAIQRALQIDPNHSRSYYIQGLVLTAYKYDFIAGPAALRKASELDPGNADILFGHGVAAMDLGRFEEAVSLLRRALQRDPLRPRFYEFLGRTFIPMDRFDDAEDQFKKQSELSPGYPGAWYRVGRMLALRGHASEAIEVLKKETSLSYQLTGLAMAHYAAGNQAAADSALDALIDQFALGSAFQVAEVYAVRRDAKNTFLWLDAAYDNRDSGLATLLATLEFRFLHGDPRWETFLGNFGLLEAWLAMPPEHGGPSPVAND